MKLPKSKTYYISLDLYFHAEKKVKRKYVRVENVKGNQYSTSLLGDEEDFVPSDFTVVESNLFIGLKKRTIELICKIVADLKIGNALWYFDHTKNTRDATAIKELRDKEILFKTDTTDIHFVNPKYLRKGTELEVLALTTKSLEKVSKVSRHLIKPLKSNGTTELNSLDLHAAG